MPSASTDGGLPLLFEMDPVTVKAARKTKG
jgi:hypothetical protein